MTYSVRSGQYKGWKWRVVSRGSGLPRWTGIACLVVALLFFAALLRYQLRLVIFGTYAQGQVVAFDKLASGRRAPRVRVITDTGESIEFRGASMRGAPLAVDDIVPVYYLASDPTFGEIATFRRFWLGVAVSSACTVLLLWLGIWILRSRRGSTPRKE